MIDYQQMSSRCKRSIFVASIIFVISLIIYEIWQVEELCIPLFFGGVIMIRSSFGWIHSASRCGNKFAIKLEKYI